MARGDFKGNKLNSREQREANGGPKPGSDGRYVSETKGGNLRGGDQKGAKDAVK